MSKSDRDHQMKMKQITLSSAQAHKAVRDSHKHPLSTWHSFHQGHSVSLTGSYHKGCFVSLKDSEMDGKVEMKSSKREKVRKALDNGYEEESS